MVYESGVRFIRMSLLKAESRVRVVQNTAKKAVKTARKIIKNSPTPSASRSQAPTTRGLVSRAWNYYEARLLLPTKPRDMVDTSRKTRRAWIKEQLPLCLDESLPQPLGCRLARHLEFAAARLDKRRYNSIYYVEKWRFNQRQRAMSSQKTSVIIFMCQGDDPSALQKFLYPYAWCAHAVKYLTEKYNSSYRIVVCHGEANPQSLASAAAEKRLDITGVNITYKPYITSYDQMSSVVEEIDPNTEEIALAYISSHGGTNELFFGQWYAGMGSSVMREDSLRQLCALLRARKSADMQVFCNSCFSNTKSAPFMAREMPGTIVIGANNSIPTGMVDHAFEVDALHKRLYFSVNTTNPSRVELFANVERAAPVPSESAAASSSNIIDLTEYMKQSLIF